MRNGHQNNNKRMRGRNRKGQNPLTRVYESNGPDVKVRGTAHHVAEKYLQLARDASSSGDPVGAESYYQHAEHYFRVIAAVNEQFRQQQPNFGEGQGSYDDGEDEPGENEPYATREPYSQPQEFRGEFQPREQRDHGGDNRDNRDNNRGHRDNRDNRGDHRRHRDNRDNNRDRFQSRDRGPQPFRGNEEQPRIQPQDDAALEQLPAFVTGGIPASAPQPDVPVDANGANGHEGGADRFPLHRRRRRRNGPRENAGGDVESAPTE
ncbi:hypothetical protein GJW-30_1_01008 [Variibacter gotjawalensis]|uniref:DUF4167 domain-containing protein n=1 Tax=Variibacter gotjawalensis TaxID=1333996 RepID=A0A0S3PR98_9BRAD|nr:DUF4167 domain-containing protein [Variibacter gotjawalensis]NIK48788.1 hypothetical protein [Variibacter gotjawalensis]RZS50649.1 uncharacterized protein DUF4167 [Variibacter gotjawalensis]BAT58482.1 hypothetical protein GJW-30_1_01008 [Variibacter gotjawalensis]